MLLGGCKKKKPVVIPPQAQAPAATESAPAQPAPQPQPTVETPPAPTTTQPKTGNQENVATKPKPKAKRRSPQVTKRNPPAPKPTESANATASANIPPANNGQPEISLSMDQAQLARRKQLTEELLQSTDADLKSINRTLTGDENSMVEQARSYMSQSRAAIEDGDLDRASNLAQKAHLLADALTKH
ncbi:MAG TPA: hypothetical protein VGR50_07095 [Terriglobales bacterium]|nr:hypothetical protein [Terriglobales bacterium]